MTGARVAVKILELAFQKALWSVEASPAPDSPNRQQQLWPV